jgi:hypothetical protein
LNNDENVHRLAPRGELLERERVRESKGVRGKKIDI